MNLSEWGIIALVAAATVGLLLWSRSAIRDAAGVWAKTGRVVAILAMISLGGQLVAVVVEALTPRPILQFTFATAAGITPAAGDGAATVLLTQQSNGAAQVWENMFVPRTLEVSGFSDATMTWVIAVSVADLLMWMIVALVLFALCHDLIRTAGFTERARGAVTMSATAMLTLAVFREVASKFATMGIYDEMALSDFTVNSWSITWTFFVVALGLAVLRSLISAGVRNATEVDGLV